MVAQVSKSTGSRDEFGTHAEVELKTDEYSGVQACGVWVPENRSDGLRRDTSKETERQTNGKNDKTEPVRES